MLNAKFDSISKKNKETQNKFGGLQYEVADLKKDVSKLSRELMDKNLDNQRTQETKDQQIELQQRQIQDYEIKLSRKIKENGQLKEKFEASSKENSELMLAAKEERQKFKQDMSETNDEIRVLSSKKDQLEELIRCEQGNTDDILREIRTGYEDQIKELKSTRQKALIEASEFKVQLEATDKKLNKEQSLVESLQTRQTLASEQLSETSDQLHKLKTDHEKLQKRSTK